MLSANYELPFGQGRKWVSAVVGPARRHHRRLAAERHLPGALGVPGHGDRQPQPFAAGDARQTERPNCVGDPKPSDQNINHWLDIDAFQIAPLGTFGNCPIGVARAPGYKNIDAVLSKQFSAGGHRYFEFRAEAFNLTNTPSFGPPARDINAPNTFGTITSTVSTARTVEFVMKFFF